MKRRLSGHCDNADGALVNLYGRVGLELNPHWIQNQPGPEVSIHV